MLASQVRIYSEEDVPRLRYIAGIILGDILGLPWEIITDKRKLGKHPVINYSGDRINGALKILPDSLLFETGLMARELTVNEWRGLPVFFQNASDSDIPFDIFAASFFLVSRYEEYFDCKSDESGRFQPSISLAFKNGFLERPVIELWARELSRCLVRKFQTLTFKRNEFRSLITFDADEPFAYLGKNIFSSLGGMLRDLTNNDGHATDRYRIVVKGEKDPFEVFDYISDTIVTNNAEARFFFPVGDHSRFDKNPSWKNEEYRDLIKRLAGKFETGLHPSYFVSESYRKVISEKERLESVLGKEITISRFHSIRLFFPASYDDLEKAGITEDYSMGYPEEPGFRASIARPFYFYNISEEKQTNLKIFPFQIMDSTLFRLKRLDPESSKATIMKILNETKRAGGTFVSIWHNTSLLDNQEGKDWRAVFEYLLKAQIQ